MLYPLILLVLGRKSNHSAYVEPGEWPEITIVLPVYNEEHVIARTLDALLAVDYPSHLRHVLVVSDASSDRTDKIVKSYAGRGVELLRQKERSGKTAAENAARHHVRGEVVVNTDASVRLAPNSLKPLVAAFFDETVGIASGRDVSVGGGERDANVGESRYVGYEMWVRERETRAGGIVGASGCFFATRADLHEHVVPDALSRDFAAPLIAREHGYRSVSVSEAVCFVPRQGSLRREYRRKVRTMTRGLETLYYKRHLLNPFKHGRFGWMILSHKLVRWLVPWGTLSALIGLVAVAASESALPIVVLVVAIFGVCAAVAWFWPASRAMPRFVAFPGYLALGLVAGMHAWLNALRGELNPIWEPSLPI